MLNVGECSSSNAEKLAMTSEEQTLEVSGAYARIEFRLHSIIRA